jgi:GTP pyrophosphokinase
MEDMMISLAKCCNPVRGEEIVGYISRGKGVSVHSLVCPNVSNLMYGSERRIDVEWTAGKDGNLLFDVKLILDVEDHQGLLAKIVNAVADEKTNIRNVDAKTFETTDAQITMVVAVADRKQMERVMNRIRRIKGVRAVDRSLS